ncbi:MAG: alpha/beta hydrolase family protein [Aggregatilineales bacterium]
MMYRILILSILLLGFSTMANAQRYDAPPYAQSGTYAVGTMELTIEDDNRPLKVTVWYPADEAAGDEPVISYNLTGLLNIPGTGYRDAAVFSDAAPYPLIVYSHGNNGARVVSSFMTEHLASQGFIVIAADHPGNDIAARLAGEADFAEIYALRPMDVLRQIDYAADVLNAKDGALAGLIDMAQVGVVGHSFGGWTVLSTAGARIDMDRLTAYCDDNPGDGVCGTEQLASEIAAIRGYDAVPDSPWEAVSDPRITAVVALAPWNAPLMELSEVTADTLIIVGSADGTTIPERDAFPIYERLQSPRQMMTLQLADHYIFVDSCLPSKLQHFHA